MSRLSHVALTAGPNALLTVRGRRTGQPRSSRVAFLDFGEWGLLQAASNDANWVRNLHASRVAVVSRGGPAKTFDAEALAPETAGHVLHDLLAPFPRFRLTRRRRAGGPAACCRPFTPSVSESTMPSPTTSAWRGASTGSELRRSSAPREISRRAFRPQTKEPGDPGRPAPV